MKGDSPINTIRILSKTLQPVIKTKTNWKNLSPHLKTTPNLAPALNAIHLFKKNNLIKELVDTKAPKFLKGGLTPSGKSFGARITILPSKHLLDKAFSLFADDLTIHDETSNTHWDVIFKNPTGKYSYLYTLEKKKKAKKKKFSAVDDFDKNLSKINRAVNKKIKESPDKTALATRTLLDTKMRVGNEVYYKAHGHKGLTTLKKGDIRIEDARVTFSFISKDGVPQTITAKFSQEYISNLQKILNKSKKSDFIFTNDSKKPLKDRDFSKAFKEYCGEEFYPHIVRSHYATKKAEAFLKKHKKSKKASKSEIDKLFTHIAEKLGHKKYSKGEKKWKTDYGATIHYYIRPDFVEKILKLRN
ncbi:tyrosine-type recombinase/integrase [archaeon]|jgi:DNA topoisomerase IB|nr:tyrosine-type recombinase/integrase [archaeon]MBT3577351.1 tyrosine-type recombinase/integrase [archaeon]MBT6820406.1 tyrosine-type recombinase/integrase [archaeon]MBT6956169.1 tyrosine-type recombinase/integrase [archaeon]MBT7025220.1 tyrosine-type recombinase/integrase [archaeon]